MVLDLRDFLSMSVMRALLALIVLAAGNPVGLAARPSPQQTPQGVIIGTVSERGSQQPIALAIVRLAGTDNSVTTNAIGQFRIEIAPGTRELQVTALGYRTFDTAPLTVALGSDTRVTITLEREPLMVDRLIVTAMKTALSSADVTALITVVDREDIDARGDLELVDALESAPGLMHTAQASSFESIELRGMPREGNEFETTLLLIDGVPQTDSRNSARVINLPIDHADAIEVVNGPNSALYGRTALGGAINVITAMPTAQPRLSAELQAGEFGHIRGAVSASGPLRDRGGYFLSWSSTENDGFYSGDSAYDVDETAVFAKFVITPDDMSEAWISVNTVTSDNSLPTSVPVVGGELLSDLEPRFDLLANINLPTANFHQEELRLTGHYSRDLGSRLTFTNTFSYRDIQYKFEESGDIIGAPFDLVAGTLTMYPFSLQSDEEIVYEEARFAYQPPGNIDHELLVGGSFESNTGFRRGDLIFTDAVTFGMPIDFLDPTPPPRTDWEYFEFGGDKYRLRSYGAYFQYQIAPLPRVRLTAAGRYDRLDLRNKETFRAGQPVSEATFDAFSPKISALYTLIDAVETETLGQVNLNLYVAYSEAFKPPRSPSGLQPPGEDDNLEPEDLTNYEVGVKSSFADGRVSLQATYFQMERDGIVVSTQEGPFFRDSNAGKQDFEGVEVAMAWAPRPSLNFHSNLALYKNRFGDFVIENEFAPDVALTGNRLPAVPDKVFNLGGSYAPTDNLGLTVGFKYVGDRFSDQRNLLLLDSYTLLDGSISWSAEPVRFTLSGHNLTDKRYFTSGGSNADSVNPAAPRQLVFIVSYVYN